MNERKKLHEQATDWKIDKERALFIDISEASGHRIDQNIYLHMAQP